jgi:hypothetical protein
MLCPPMSKSVNVRLPAELHFIVLYLRRCASIRLQSGHHFGGRPFCGGIVFRNVLPDADTPPILVKSKLGLTEKPFGGASG